MAKQSPPKKKKETTYQIRVSADLLTSFQDAAKGRDRSAAAEIRGYMRRYVNKHAAVDLSALLVEDDEDGEDLPF